MREGGRLKKRERRGSETDVPKLYTIYENEHSVEIRCVDGGGAKIHAQTDHEYVYNSILATKSKYIECNNISFFFIGKWLNFRIDLWSMQFKHSWNFRH